MTPPKIDWMRVQPPQDGFGIAVDAKGIVYNVPLADLPRLQVFEGVTVVARSAAEFHKFVCKELAAEAQWRLRKVFTIADRKLLADMGIGWDAPRQLNFVIERKRQ